MEKRKDDKATAANEIFTIVSHERILLQVKKRPYFRSAHHIARTITYGERFPAPLHNFTPVRAILC